MGAWLTRQPLCVLLLNKLSSLADPSLSNLYNSFQFFDKVRWGWVGGRVKNLNQLKAHSWVWAARNKLPENNFKVQHKGWIAKECQQILKWKGRSLIYSFWISTTRQRAPKIFATCVGGKMMRGGFCQFQHFARNDQKVEGLCLRHWN